MRCFYFLYSKSLYCSKKQAEKNKDVNFMQSKAGSFDFNTDSEIVKEWKMGLEHGDVQMGVSTIKTV